MKIKILSFLSFILSFLLLWGCEKDFTNIVDVENPSYQVVRVNVKSSFQYPIDTMAVFRLELNSSKDINDVFCDVYSPDKKKINTAPLYLLDNGNPANGDIQKDDNIYSAVFPLDSNQINGNYEVKYFVNDRLNKTKQVAISTYYFNNGQDKVAPVISNLVCPDSIARGASFIFTITANDPNGLSDIRYVYFELYRPDGSAVENPSGSGNTMFLMHDDGDYEHFGDEIAGDGIYSFKNYFSGTAPIGIWRFEFQALDWSGLRSNKIIHLMEVL
ncbi:MAG: hypothetical protein RBR74_08985 [Ignavibacteriaceae bacterium]|jgi:hypothetical protein|nr:hypothetical protein [Ignavibacteriaceae bacterium]